MIAKINLQTLHCIAQSDGDGATPYLWVELLQIDDSTLGAGGAGAAAVSFPPAPDGAEVVIAHGMRAGGQAFVPDALARLAARFVNTSSRRDLVLVAALWDRHDTPGSAVLAGYDAFLAEVRDAVAANLAGLAANPNTDAIAAVKKRVHDKVEAAISDALSGFDKAEIAVDLETVDSLVDSDFVHLAQVTATTAPIGLHFGAGSANDFRIDGELVVTADPCEEELILVSEATTAIANTQGALRQLANAHGGEPTPADEQQIATLERTLATERQRLTAAKAALARCRTAHVPHSPPVASPAQLVESR